MKIGLSTYSLYAALQKKEMTVLEIISWIRDQGGEHVEISAIGYDLLETPTLVEEIRHKAEQVGLELSSYTIGSQLLQATEEAGEAELHRIMQHVDIAHQLGVHLMRHDVLSRQASEACIEQFDLDLPVLAKACRRIAEYAEQYGITTSVENHGFHVQHSERVRRLIRAVDRPNYRWTVDVGNFACVDEDPVIAVRTAMPLVSMVHFKDFYIRPADQDPGEGWFRSAGGKYLRGAIVGQGDLDIRKILREITVSGYDGYLSVEFEGMEDCRLGSRLGMENLRRMMKE
jgi:sugar phosphate isomerase/epimerase